MDRSLFTLTFDSVRAKKKSFQFGLKRTSEQADLDQIIRHKARLEFVHCIRSTFEKMREDKTKSNSKTKRFKETMEHFTQLKEQITKYANANDEFITDLLADLTGQVQLAMENENWFMKWGIHYLPSLTRKYDEKDTINRFSRNK